MMDFHFDEALEKKAGGSKMEQNQNRQSNLIDTTDSLEAVAVLRCWKNFFFVIVILCLLVVQGSFWLVNTGVVKTSEEPAGKEVLTTENQQIKIVSVVTETDAQDPNLAARTLPQKTKKTLAFLRKIEFEELTWLVGFVNFVLVIASVLYCLTILFILKISFVGRLGGMNHICRAFFLSLVFVVLIFPWQIIFKEVVAGVIYTPEELLESLKALKTEGIIGHIYLYLRYCIFWMIAVLFAIAAQVRSGRWARASLRRLEVI